MTASRALRAAAALFLLLAPACGSSDDTLFQRAEALYMEGRFSDAVPVLKEFLLSHPTHSGAHLYLAICYTVGDIWPTAAEGEALTALTLYRKDGRKSTIERYPDEYFELKCYFALMDAVRMQINMLLSLPGSPPAEMREALDRFRAYLQEAQAIAPDDPGVKDNAEKLTQMEAMVDALPPQWGIPRRGRR
jgi:tetratricopeptide (TPR) repeat protein